MSSKFMSHVAYFDRIYFDLHPAHIHLQVGHVQRLMDINIVPGQWYKADPDPEAEEADM